MRYNDILLDDDLDDPVPEVEGDEPVSEDEGDEPLPLPEPMPLPGLIIFFL